MRDRYTYMLYNIRMEKKISKNGTSATITLSPQELSELGVSVGDVVQTEVVKGTIVIRPVNKYQSMDGVQLRNQLKKRFKK